MPIMPNIVSVNLFCCPSHVCFQFNNHLVTATTSHKEVINNDFDLLYLFCNSIYE